MKRNYPYANLGCLAILVLQVSLSQAAGPIVDTVYGKVQGLRLAEEGQTAVDNYRGIPFAKPPQGDLRWRPPEAPEAWDDIRDCTAFGPKSLQGRGSAEGQSEDCLYLNVWTPAGAEAGGDQAARKLPVMVWIHGGGLTSGAGSLDGYNGEHFARQGVVLVTINYRLGALGFLAHPELSAESEAGVSGNYGFLDQIAALKWVQENVASFGGDADNVTIFGESAGGTSVFVLTASPLAKGLFDKAILQSAWLDPPIFQPMQMAEEVGVQAASRVVEATAGAGQVEALRELSGREILAKLKSRSPVAVDGWLLPDFPQRLVLEQRWNQVPVIAGTNRDEGTMFVRGNNYDSVEQFRQEQMDRFGEHAESLLKFYDTQRKDQIRPTLVQMITDGWFVQPTRRYLRAVAASNTPCWMYHFTQTSPSWPVLGAAHAAEIGFVFNTLGESKLDEENRRISEVLMGYWVQFAKTGDPNRAGLPDWPEYGIESDEHLIIDGEIQIAKGLRCEACDLLDGIREVRSIEAVTEAVAD